MFLILLLFLSSGFVPTELDARTRLRWFAENQPFTPIIETLAGLLLGTPIGDSGVIAVAWCVAISLLGYLWARRSLRARSQAVGCHLRRGRPATIDDQRLSRPRRWLDDAQVGDGIRRAATGVGRSSRMAAAKRSASTV